MQEAASVGDFAACADKRSHKRIVEILLVVAETTLQIRTQQAVRAVAHEDQESIRCGIL